MRKRFSSRRRSPMAQKPWNKVQRMEKFWTMTSEQVNFQPSLISASAGATAPGLAIVMEGNKLAADQFVTAQPRALQHVKVHRIQGHIWCWLAPNPSGVLQNNGFEHEAATTQTLNAAPHDDLVLPIYQGEFPPPNVAMLAYAWLKLKNQANTPNDDVLASMTNYDPRPDQDSSNLLLRDDIIGWGHVPVFGVTPYMYNHGSTAGNQPNHMTVVNAGQYVQPHVAKIPLPRIPKAGLNLRQGESLICAINAWQGPGGIGNWAPDDNPVWRDVVVSTQIRVLCSI